jgi:hypothetical protein
LRKKREVLLHLSREKNLKFKRESIISMFGSFPPSPLVVSASKVYSGLGADIVYGIISFIDLPGRGFGCNRC